MVKGGTDILYTTRRSTAGIQQGHASRGTAPLGMKRLVTKPEELRFLESEP